MSTRCQARSCHPSTVELTRSAAIRPQGALPLLLVCVDSIGGSWKGLRWPTDTHRVVRCVLARLVAAALLLHSLIVNQACSRTRLSDVLSVTLSCGGRLYLDLCLVCLEAMQPAGARR